MLTKIHIVKAIVFPVIMYGYESWAIKKAECRGIDTFGLQCWRRPLKVPWMTGRSSQSVLKEINPEYHWKDWCWSSNTLATWSEEPSHWKRPWCWERLKAGREGSNRGWDGWMASSTQQTWAWANSGRWWRTGKSGVLPSMVSQRVGHDWATEQHLLYSLQTTGGTTGDSQPLRPFLSPLFGPPYLICLCRKCPPLGVELCLSK